MNKNPIKEIILGILLLTITRFSLFFDLNPKQIQVPTSQQPISCFIRPYWTFRKNLSSEQKVTITNFMETRTVSIEEAKTRELNRLVKNLYEQKPSTKSEVISMVSNTKQLIKFLIYFVRYEIQEFFEDGKNPERMVFLYQNNGCIQNKTVMIRANPRYLINHKVIVIPSIIDDLDTELNMIAQKYQDEMLMNKNNFD